MRKEQLFSSTDDIPARRRLCIWQQEGCRALSRQDQFWLGVGQSRAHGLKHWDTLFLSQPV